MSGWTYKEKTKNPRGALNSPLIAIVCDSVLLTDPVEQLDVTLGLNFLFLTSISVHSVLSVQTKPGSLLSRSMKILMDRHLLQSPPFFFHCHVKTTSPTDMD